MADPNLHDFYNRVSRIEIGRAQGFGFEAVGTLGLSHYRRAPRKRTPILAPLLIVLATAIGLKGAILYNVGETTYNQRVAEMRVGDDFERLGAVLMRADPATVRVSELIRNLVH